jgi:hypothetical protein
MTTRDTPEAVWTCSVSGPVGHADIPPGGDFPMRRAVRAAYLALTGQEETRLSSGWGTAQATRDTPGAALAAALLDANGPDHSRACLETTCPVAAELVDFAPTVLAALDGWTLIEIEDEQMLTPAPDAWAELSAKVRRQEVEIARLREALRREVGRQLTDARVEELMRQEAIPLHGRGISVDLQARGVAAALRALVAYDIVDAALAPSVP